MPDTRAQLRSTTVVLGGMGLLAVALTACSSDPDKRCVDRDSYNVAKGYHIVSDKNCKFTSGANGAYYYGGKKKGSWVRGGSFTRPGKSSGSSGGSHYDDDNHSVHRGGFGSGHGSSGG